MFKFIRNRGLEVFTGILLITGEASIISITINKQQGFFTLNVGSPLFEWLLTGLEEPAAPATAPAAAAPAPGGGEQAAAAPGGDDEAYGQPDATAGAGRWRECGRC